jgi:hypothetical protein
LIVITCCMRDGEPEYRIKLECYTWLHGTERKARLGVEYTQWSITQTNIWQHTQFRRKLMSSEQHINRSKKKRWQYLARRAFGRLVSPRLHLPRHQHRLAIRHQQTSRSSSDLMVHVPEISTDYVEWTQARQAFLDALEWFTVDSAWNPNVHHSHQKVAHYNLFPWDPF